MQQVLSVTPFIRHARVGGHPVVEQMVERFIIQMTVLDSRFHGNDGKRAGQQVSSVPLFIRHARAGGHPAVE